MFDNHSHRRPRGPGGEPPYSDHHRAHRAFGRRGVFGPLFGGRGPMVRRGDVRAAVLALLAEQPMHGYQVMQELTERSRGAWRPSAGSIYPTLQQLEDEGLVRAEERDGRRVFTLTDAGRAQAAQDQPGRSGGRGPRPWDYARADDRSELGSLFRQVAEATMQVADVGTPDAKSRARDILVETRRALYRLLAEDDAAATSEGETINPNA